MMRRCRNCGMLAFGSEAPDNCPTCGSHPKEFQKVFELEDISGTETGKNLQKAFAGESQANRKYILYAQIARLEGNRDAEEMFLQFSYDETWHALSQLMYLLGGTKTTTENLLESIEGEKYESEKLYQEFAEKAKEEGLSSISLFFRELAKVEGEHAMFFKKLLDKMGQENE